MSKRLAWHLLPLPLALALTNTITASLTLTGCTPLPPRPAPTPAGAPAVPPEVAIAEFIELLRPVRKDAGCPELAWDDRAATIATAHSEDMQRRHYLSHRSPEGTTPFTRMAAAGITFSAAAENLAQGARTGADALRLWLQSPGHRRNLLDCTYTRQGIGIADGYWTQLLFTP